MTKNVQTCDCESAVANRWLVMEFYGFSAKLSSFAMSYLQKEGSNGQNTSKE